MTGGTRDLSEESVGLDLFLSSCGFGSAVWSFVDSGLSLDIALFVFFFCLSFA